MILIAVLGAIAGAIGLIVVLRRPHWAAVLVLAMWPVEQLVQVYLPVLRTSGKSWLINVLIGTIALTAVVARTVRPKPIAVGYFNIVSISCIGLWALMLVGLVWTPSEKGSEFVQSGVPYWILLIFILPLLISDLDDLEQVLKSYLLLGTVVTLLILVNPNAQFENGRLRMDFGTGWIAEAQHSNPLALGTLGGHIALIAIFVRPTGAHAWYTLLRFAAFLSGMGLAIGSGSRGQVLATIICGVSFFPLARRVADPKAFVARIAGFVLLALLFYASMRFFISEQNLKRWDPLSAMDASSRRVEMSQDLIVAWAERPEAYLFGLGPNAFGAVCDQWFPTPYVHNFIAEALGEEGIFGLACVAAMLWFTFRYGRRLLQLVSNDPAARSVVATFAAICMYAVVIGLKEGHPPIIPRPYLYFLILVKVAIMELRMAAVARTATLELDDAHFDPEYDDYEGRPLPA